MKRNGDTGDKRTWHIGGREVNKGQDDERFKGFGRRKEKAEVAEEESEEVVGRSEEPASGGAVDLLGSELLGLDLSEATKGNGSNLAVDSLTPSSAAPVASPSALTPTKKTFLPTPLRKGTIPLTHGVGKWLKRLVYTADGILYEDDQLQIGLKTEFHGAAGRIAIFFGNKLPVSLDSFTATVESANPDTLAVLLPKIAEPRLGSMSQSQQIVQVECKDIFVSPPILNIYYLAGSLQTISLRLPLYLTKFLEPIVLTQADFFERWKSIGGAPREAQNIFGIDLVEGKVDVNRNKRIVRGVRFGVLEGIDPNGDNIVGAAVLHLTGSGKVGCLLRVEPSVEAKVSLSSLSRPESRTDVSLR